MFSIAKAIPIAGFILLVVGAADAHKDRPLITRALKISVDGKPAWWAEVRADGTIKDSDGKLAGSKFEGNQFRDKNGRVVLVVKDDGTVEGGDHGATPLSFTPADELITGDNKMWIDDHGVGYSQTKGKDKLELYGVHFEGAAGRARRAALLILWFSATAHPSDGPAVTK